MIRGDFEKLLHIQEGMPSDSPLFKFLTRVASKAGAWALNRDPREIVREMIAKFLEQKSYKALRPTKSNPRAYLAMCVRNPYQGLPSQDEGGS